MHKARYKNGVVSMSFQDFHKSLSTKASGRNLLKLFQSEKTLLDNLKKYRQEIGDKYRNEYYNLNKLPRFYLNLLKLPYSTIEIIKALTLSGASNHLVNYLFLNNTSLLKEKIILNLKTVEELIDLLNIIPERHIIGFFDIINSTDYAEFLSVIFSDKDSIMRILNYLHATNRQETVSPLFIKVLITNNAIFNPFIQANAAEIIKSLEERSRHRAKETRDKLATELPLLYSYIEQPQSDIQPSNNNVQAMETTIDDNDEELLAYHDKTALIPEFKTKPPKSKHKSNKGNCVTLINNLLDDSILSDLANNMTCLSRDKVIAIESIKQQEFATFKQNSKYELSNINLDGKTMKLLRDSYQSYCETQTLKSKALCELADHLDQLVDDLFTETDAWRKHTIAISIELIQLAITSISAKNDAKREKSAELMMYRRAHQAKVKEGIKSTLQKNTDSLQAGTAKNDRLLMSDLDIGINGGERSASTLYTPQQSHYFLRFNAFFKQNNCSIVDEHIKNGHVNTKGGINKSIDRLSVFNPLQVHLHIRAKLLCVIMDKEEVTNYVNGFKQVNVQNAGTKRARTA